MRSYLNTLAGKIAPEPGAEFFYQYDFGDNWQHQTIVEKILAPEPRVSYPRCIAGQRACPPEDVGGVALVVSKMALRELRQTAAYGARLYAHRTRSTQRSSPRRRLRARAGESWS